MQILNSVKDWEGHRLNNQGTLTFPRTILKWDLVALTSLTWFKIGSYKSGKSSILRPNKKEPKMTQTSFQKPFFLIPEPFFYPLQSCLGQEVSGILNRKKMKYILVTGGVISGIGKGVVARLVCCSFLLAGLRVAIMPPNIWPLSPVEGSGLIVRDQSSAFQCSKSSAKLVHGQPKALCSSSKARFILLVTSHFLSDYVVFIN